MNHTEIKKAAHGIEENCTQILFEFIGTTPNADRINAFAQKIEGFVKQIQFMVADSPKQQKVVLRWTMELIKGVDNRRESDALKFIGQNLQRATEQYNPHSVASLVLMGINTARVKNYSDSRIQKQTVDLRAAVDDDIQTVWLKRAASDYKIGKITLKSITL